MEPETKKVLNGFLAAIEKKAFTMVYFAVGNTEDALDLAQETMLTFVRLYSNRPEEEWKVLLYRILHSRITDWYRRTVVRKRLRQWFGFAKEDEKENLLENLVKSSDISPADMVEKKEFNAALEKALSRLPARQQQGRFLTVPLLLILAGWIVNVDFKANVKDFFTIRTNQLPRERGGFAGSFKHGMKTIFIPAVGANLKDFFDFYRCHFFFHFSPQKNYHTCIYYSIFSLISSSE